MWKKDDEKTNERKKGGTRSRPNSGKKTVPNPLTKPCKIQREKISWGECRKTAAKKGATNVFKREVGIPL